MIDKNRTYRTRDGREVRIYATDAGINQNLIHGATKDGEIGWVAHVWLPDGSHERINYLDLIEVKPRHKRTVWLNVACDEIVTLHSTRDHADRSARFRIACIKVDLDFQEGDGL